MLASGFQASFGPENPEQIRHLVSIAQPDVAYISKENMRDQEVLICHYLHFISFNFLSFPWPLKHDNFFPLTSQGRFIDN